MQKSLMGQHLDTLWIQKKAPVRVISIQDYAENVFIPAILKMLEPILRLDVIWDKYLQNSLKTKARENHGSGTLIKIDKGVRLPSNWQNLLRCDQNKESLFKLLAVTIQEFQFPPCKQVVITFEERIVSSPMVIPDL